MDALCWSSCEEIPQVQGKRNSRKMVGVARRHQRADTLKTESQVSSQSNHTRTTALSNSMKWSQALWGVPSWEGHDAEDWQSVVHWRREGQSTSVFLPWDQHEQYEKAKWEDTERGTPQVSRCQYATVEWWRNNSRKNEGIEPNQKKYPVMDVTGDRRKVQCYKEQYSIGNWMLSPWIKANWKWSNRRWQEWTSTF